MKKPSNGLWGLTAVATLVIGCISHERVIYQEEDRLTVDFESETAGRVFYEALANSKHDDQRRQSKTSLYIPIVLDHVSEVVSGPNHAFNQAVKACDANNDQVITEKEANIYARVAN